MTFRHINGSIDIEKMLENTDVGTGTVWLLSTKVRRQVVHLVCEVLEKHYGRPRHGNPHDPIADLIYIILSNKTTPSQAQSTYTSIRETFQEWDHVVSARASTLQSLIRSAGLSKIKTAQIRNLLKKIRQDFGEYSLDQLAFRTDSEVENYLISLPGVSTKVARCMMLYALGRAVLPVDVHVHRIANRNGGTEFPTWRKPCHFVA